MDLSEARAHANDARHPWEIARARHFVDVTAPLLPRGGRVLDVGAGDAFVARRLLERAPGVQVVAWDHEYTEEDVRAFAAPGLVPTRDLPQGEPFDVALLLDVLEHVPDDTAFLRTVARRVRPGGVLVVSVPAWPALFSLHDMKLKHLRRYTPEAARALVEREGLRIERSGGLFHSLLPMRAVAKRLEGLTRTTAGGVGAWRGSPTLTTAATAALRADTLLSRALSRVRVDAPGLSWWCVARV